MQLTEQQIDAATIAAMRTQNWHISREEDGTICWLSEGGLARACFVAGLQAGQAPAPDGIDYEWEYQKAHRALMQIREITGNDTAPTAAVNAIFGFADAALNDYTERPTNLA